MFRLFLYLCCFCSLSNLLAQRGIQTESNLGVETLVKSVFIKGNCKNANNISAIGNDTLGIGQFDNAQNIFNFEDGIIISTGNIGLASGPNENIDASYAFNTTSNDSDLSQLATGELFDVTGIEFDFIPINNRVTFKYVFASEEYCEFVGTSFNDVFGFFVSGPGINGTFDNNAINVASLNFTDESVSINNVNHLENEDLYISNVTTIDAENCQIGYSPIYQDLIEYDGFTVPLTASFSVIPCEIYHIRLVIGDVGDANLDSAVFLESKSFDLGEKVTIRAEVPGREDAVAYEDCIDGQFVFTRNNLISISEDCTIEYNISPESTVMNGVDILDIPLRITIPAGDSSTILPITVINDNLVEGIETLKLALEYECDCLDPSLSELIISDPLHNLSASLDEITVCTEQTFTLTPEIMGGVPPFDFLWSTGATTETLTDNIAVASTYSLTLTDFCDNTVTKLTNVAIQSTPTATLVGDYDLCEVVETGIPVLLEGNPPWSIEYSIDEVEQNPIDNIDTTPFYLNTKTEGTYSLTAFNDAYCNGSIVNSAIVEYSTFDISTDVVPPSCLYNSDGNITITQLEAIPPFLIEWNTATEDDYFVDNLKTGIYTLNILDGNGCLYQDTFDLKSNLANIEDCVPVYVPNVFSPNLDGVNDLFTLFFNDTNTSVNIISFQIYNRWGGLLFEQTNFTSGNGTTGWDGYFNGQLLNAGVYVYKILLAFEGGDSLLLSGDITLLR